jgi:hypothetical protein
MDQLPLYLNELVNRKVFNVNEITQAMSKFLKNVPDLTNDYPKITTYLSNSMFTLHELNALKWSDLVWFEPPATEDDAPFVEQYYHLMARVLYLLYQKNNDMK